MSLDLVLLSCVAIYLIAHLLRLAFKRHEGIARQGGSTDHRPPLNRYM